ALLAELPRLLIEPDQVTRNAALSGLAYAAQWQRAVALFPARDSYARLAVATALAQKAQWQRGLELLQGAWHLQLCNAVMNGCARAGQWQLCLELLCGMGLRRLACDDASFSTAIVAVGTQWQQALALLESAVETLGVAG
ncbi:unnamed protein product, partial [Effrenium voratum]